MKADFETGGWHQQITLRDGRKLGFAEYGTPKGVPVIYFHGWPSSRLEPRAIDQPSRDMGIRLIAPDRPGYGLSDFKARRSIPDWAADVSEMADYLELKRFAVLGVSGGGPYAAACTARLPERVSTTLLVCSVAPMEAPGSTDGMVALNRWLLSFAQRAPWLAQRVAGLFLKAIWRRGEQVIPESIEIRLPASDKLALTSQDLRRALIASSKEALRRGVQAAAADGLLYARPWGFRLQDIRVPVRLWHGEMDVVVPPSMGRYLAQTIPGCQAKFYPEDGHFSLPFNRTREIFEALA
ncbi:MAG TPA: alpha/beta hydrolase [Clostridia bacterium]|nr:alpha/beta hydrolase [Clostridia bacterium]